MSASLSLSPWSRTSSIQFSFWLDCVNDYQIWYNLTDFQVIATVRSLLQFDEALDLISMFLSNCHSLHMSPSWLQLQSILKSSFVPFQTREQAELELSKCICQPSETIEQFFLRFATLAANLSYKLKHSDQLSYFIAGLPSNLRKTARNCCADTPNISISEVARYASLMHPSSSILSQHSFVIPLVTNYLSDKDVVSSLILVNKAIVGDLKGYCVKKWIKTPRFLTITNANRYFSVGASGIEVAQLPIPLPSECHGKKFNKIWFLPSFNEVIPVGAIHDSVTYVQFSDRFNQPIAINTFPTSVTHLHFGDDFDQPLVVGSIPNSVTHLSFGSEFNQPLTVGIIPDSVTHLIFGCYEKSMAPGVIPASVTHLMPSSLTAFEEGAIPLSVTHLVCESVELLRFIPASVTFLEFLGFNESIPVGSIPNSVTHLKFCDTFDRPIAAGSIPASVTHVEFGRGYRHRVDDIPASVTRSRYSQYWYYWNF